MPDHKRRLIADIIVPILLAAGVIPPLFYQIIVLSPQQPDNYRTFYSFAEGLSGYYELKTAWKTRLISNALAWQFDRLGSWILDNFDVPLVNRPQALAMALWTVAWMVAISLLYILFMKRRAVFYILGTFAAVSFGYQDKLGTTRIYPWDMPALFFFTLFLLLFLRNRYRSLLALLPLGMGFKETVAVLALAFPLSRELPVRKRWMYFAGALVSCAVVKLGIDVVTRSSSPLITMETGLGATASALYLFQNLRSFTSLVPFLVNAGTFLAFLVLPARDGKIRALKTIAVAFAVGNFLFGTVLEYRIWFEMIPFGLYAIEMAAYGGTESEGVAGAV